MRLRRKRGRGPTPRPGDCPAAPALYGLGDNCVVPLSRSPLGVSRLLQPVPDSIGVSDLVISGALQILCALGPILSSAGTVARRIVRYAPAHCDGATAAVLKRGAIIIGAIPAPILRNEHAVVGALRQAWCRHPANQGKQTASQQKSHKILPKAHQTSGHDGPLEKPTREFSVARTPYEVDLRTNLRCSGPLIRPERSCQMASFRLAYVHVQEPEPREDRSAIIEPGCA